MNEPAGDDESVRKRSVAEVGLREEELGGITAQGGGGGCLVNEVFVGAAQTSLRATTS